MANSFEDTGFSVDEAIVRASKWWDEWRGAVRRDFNTRKEAPRVKMAAHGAPGIVIKGDEVQDLPDGILSGKAWRNLTDKERSRIVATWHDKFIRRPMLEHEAAAPAKVALEVECDYLAHDDTQSNRKAVIYGRDKADAHVKAALQGWSIFKNTAFCPYCAALMTQPKPKAMH